MLSPKKVWGRSLKHGTNTEGRNPLARARTNTRPSLGLTKMPIATARAALSGQGFVCEQDYRRYADAPHISVECTHPVPGIACKDNEHVALEYRPESGLVDRVTTRRANNCL